jgi:hypothetical protein
MNKPRERPRPADQAAQVAKSPVLKIDTLV